MVQGATRTWGLLRMRLYFPEVDRVITKSLSSSSPNHTGVATAWPVLRSILIQVFLSARVGAGIGLGMATIVKDRHTGRRIEVRTRRAQTFDRVSHQRRSPISLVVRHRLADC